MTRSEKKHLKQLQQKKYRNQFQKFVVEGWKSIHDFIVAGYVPVKIYSTKDITSSLSDKYDYEKIDKESLRQISFFKNPKDAVAIFKIPPQADLPQSNWIIALDQLQDPGNLGTIIRTADWFGIQNIVCATGTVDCYNPKVVQASMGSLAHVQVFYTDLEKYLKETSLPVYGACMQGNSLYQTRFPKQGILVTGNEGNGISSGIRKLINHRITIPKPPESKAESLNAAVATAIFIETIVRPS